MILTMSNEIIKIPDTRNILDLCVEAALQSTCQRAKCGSVIMAPNGKLVGVGYNSQPCDFSEFCIKDDLGPGFKSDRTCCIHAEQRAIHNTMMTFPNFISGSSLYFIRLDKDNIPMKAGDPYCTICSKAALDARVKFFNLWDGDGWRQYDTFYYNELSFQYGR